MKNIYKFAIVLAGAALMTACSKDYLNTSPTDSTSPDTTFESVENAAQAINGICKIMTTQHSYYGQGFNGEGTIKLMYGEYPGDDFSFPVYSPGWAPLMNQEFHGNLNSQYLHYPWYYYYMIIANANSVVARIDGATGSEAQRNFIKAQGLTFRAYAYTMLLQFYSVRWQDSNNGAERGVVLRLDESTGSIPVSTMTQCYKQIYDDLDAAIALYTASGASRKNFWEPNINVAYAIYARAAMGRDDFPKAQEMAPKAYNGYALMSVADYRKGFCEPNSEWIWGSFGGGTENLWYYSFGVTMGYNGYYVANQGYFTVANRELIDIFPNTDIRKNLFFNQSLFPDYDFNDQTLFENSQGILLDSVATAKPTEKAVALRKAMSKHAQDVAGYPSGYDQAYYAKYAHLKFAVIDQPGVMNLNHFRSSEMYLIEAEAAYRNNAPEVAKKALIALNKDSGRDPNYTCTLTGDALLQEIRNYRRLELWGEGFNWFDYKRWNIPVKRTSFQKGGTFNASIAVEIKPNDANKWTWEIPNRENDYNDDI